MFHNIAKIFHLLLITFLFAAILHAQDKVDIKDIEELILPRVEAQQSIEDTQEFIKNYEKNKDYKSIAMAIERIDAFYPDLVLPFLIEILKNNRDFNIQNSLILKFGEVGESAVPSLIEVLKNEDEEPIVLDTAAKALSYVLNSLERDSISLLIDILKTNENGEILRIVAKRLGEIGKDAKSAVPILFEVSNKTYSYRKVGQISYDDKKRKYYDFLTVPDAILNILDDLIVNGDFSENKIISDSFEIHKNELIEEMRNKIASKIDILQQRERLQRLENATPIRDFVETHPYYSAALLLIILLSIGWMIVYLANPAWLISFHEKILSRSPEIKIREKIEVPILSLISPIFLTSRALDAWVTSNLEKAKTNFENKETVKERKLYIPVKVKVKFKHNKDINFNAKNFREVFERNQSQLLIYGDGGSGKTSLVCQIAQWALNGNLFEKHFALPVFLEENFEDIQTEVKKKVKELFIGKDNNKITLNPISDALQKELLKTKRIVLIFDGISELDEKTKRQVRDNTDVNAVVYTSRNNEIMDVSKIETNNVAPEHLYHFISQFIEKTISSKKKETLFPSDELFSYCEKLSKLVGEKGISVLMAKLYAEQMIAQKRGNISDDLPNNVPELMIQSIKILHKKTPSENIDFSDVIKASKIIAFESLKKDYRPIPAKKNDIEKALENVENDKEILKHLQNRLKVIETKGIEDDKIAFKIDPLAEYLAASYLVEENSDNKTKWKNSIKEMQKKSAENNIRGFLIAVTDYCEIIKDVPKSVIEDLRIILGNYTAKIYDK